MIDSSNRFLVSAQGDDLVALGIARPRPRFTREEALCLAAWLVAMAMPADGEFEELLKRVRSS